MKLTLCYVDQTVNAMHGVFFTTSLSLSVRYLHSLNDDRTKKRKHNILHTTHIPVHITI